MRRRYLGVIPFVVLVAAWMLAPHVVDYPPYVLPSAAAVWQQFVKSVLDGTLVSAIGDSLLRLFIGFVVGNAVAVPLGLAIAMNRTASDALQPVLSFFQSIAGIAWVPLAIVWFGIGMGSVVFVVANTIFFSSIYNVVIGVEMIPDVLRRAVRSHGANRRQELLHLVLPGALAQIIVGLRTSMAYGWRALVGAEILAGTSGLGFMVMDAKQYYQTDVIIIGMLVIGALWMIIDRLLFGRIEARTIQRWGVLQR
jgi:NitT/TauT family transport system permease protein/taurine transport system permease protein